MFRPAPSLIPPIAFLLALSGLAFAAAAFADMNPSVPRGMLTKEFKSKELCIIPKTISGTGADDEATNDQKTLCQIDFDAANIAICPKTNSTNPGVTVYQLPKNSPISKATFEAKVCLRPEKERLAKSSQFPGVENVDKIAKLKSSISCSDTSSILTYFQFSQQLKGAARVPDAVIRTMDIDRHQRLVKQGLKSEIAAQWNTWAKRGGTAAARAAHPELYTPKGDFMYGALVENPTQEAFYREFYGTKHSYDQGLVYFLKTPVYKNVTDPRPVGAIIKRDLKSAAQAIQVRKDASDMIILDTILNQQDRFGNAHYKEYYQYIDGDEVKSESLKDFAKDQKLVKTAGADPKKVAKAKARLALIAKGSVVVKELVLKDNDCGVSKDNKFKMANVLKTLTHVDPSTYRAVQKLAKTFATAEGRAYLSRELLMPAEMVNGSSNAVPKNLKEVAAMLKARCESGALKLDLDIEEHLKLKPAQTGC